MKIKLTRNTVVGGRAETAGRVLDVADRDGQYLCEIGKAVPVKQALKRETATVEPDENAARNDAGEKPAK